MITCITGVPGALASVALSFVDTSRDGRSHSIAFATRLSGDF